MTFQKLRRLSLLMAAIALPGCGSLPEQCGGAAPGCGTPASSATTARPEAAPGLAPAGEGEVAATAALARAGQAGLVATERVLHFAPDSVELSADSRERLRRHAAFMAADKAVSARLEGHSDARGTPEYNMALGERRARAVAAYLQSLGVAADRLEIISYGEARPVAGGDDRVARARNHRVEIRYH